MDVGRALEPDAVPCWVFSYISLIHKETIHKSAQLHIVSHFDLKKATFLTYDFSFLNFKSEFLNPRRPHSLGSYPEIPFVCMISPAVSQITLIQLPFM